MSWYVTYLQSEAWRRRARSAKAAAGWNCQLCGRVPVEVHHRSYARLGRELPSDLVVLCEHCHGRHHEIFETEERIREFFKDNEAA